LTACPPDMLVNETVAKTLINTRVSHKADELRHQLREYFPRSEMTQNEHDGNARAEFTRHRLDVIDLDARKDFLGRHVRELYTAKGVGAGASKMQAHEPRQFPRRFFIRKSNRNVARCQPPIFTGESPRANAEKLPESEEKRQRQ